MVSLDPQNKLWANPARAKFRLISTQYASSSQWSVVGLFLAIVFLYTASSNSKSLWSVTDNALIRVSASCGRRTEITHAESGWPVLGWNVA